VLGLGLGLGLALELRDFDCPDYLYSHDRQVANQKSMQENTKKQYKTISKILLLPY